jgi:uncharacterized protein YceK
MNGIGSLDFTMTICEFLGRGTKISSTHKKQGSMGMHQSGMESSSSDNGGMCYLLILDLHML